MFNIQSEKEMIQRVEAERKKQIYEDRVKRARVAQAKAVEVLKAKNRSMIKVKYVLDEEYRNCIEEMARDFQVSKSVIVRVACRYFHRCLSLVDLSVCELHTKLGASNTNKTDWEPVFWIQEDLKKQIDKDSALAHINHSRFVRAALTVLYGDYLESYKEALRNMDDVPEFEKTMSDLIWEDMHSYEN